MGLAARPVAAASPLTAYFFWGDGCPHCAKEETLLAALEERYPDLEIRRFEVFHDKDNLALLRRVGSALVAFFGFFGVLDNRLAEHSVYG